MESSSQIRNPVSSTCNASLSGSRSAAHIWGPSLWLRQSHTWTTSRAALKRPSDAVVLIEKMPSWHLGRRYPLRSIRASPIFDVSVVTISLIVFLHQTTSGVGISYPIHSVPRRWAEKTNLHLLSHYSRTKYAWNYVNMWFDPNRALWITLKRAQFRLVCIYYCPRSSVSEILISYICRDTSMLEAHQSCAALSLTFSPDFHFAKNISVSSASARMVLSQKAHRSGVLFQPTGVDPIDLPIALSYQRGKWYVFCWDKH